MSFWFSCFIHGCFIFGILACIPETSFCPETRSHSAPMESIRNRIPKYWFPPEIIIPFRANILEMATRTKLDLRGGGGALGGREVKVKAVKKKHVAANPKPKDNEAKSDGLTRSQRRKAKDEAKAGRTAQSNAKPTLNALEEAVEIAARSASKLPKSKQSLQSAFSKLNLLDDDSDTVKLRENSASSSEKVR